MPKVLITHSTQSPTNTLHTITNESAYNRSRTNGLDLIEHVYDAQMLES